MGSILRTTDLGATWSEQTVSPETGIVASIACPSATICFAVGQGTDDVGGLILRAGTLERQNPCFRETLLK